MGIISWIILGIIIGLIANFFDNKFSIRRFVLAITLGILGALLGGVMAHLLYGTTIIGINIITFTVVMSGAAVFLYVGHTLGKTRYKYK